LLEDFEAIQTRTKPMGTGNKSTRIVAWTFLSKEEQKEWAKTRWGDI
jgi:23S rRNA (adenine1618-N6)-methyltransferase